MTELLRRNADYRNLAMAVFVSSAGDWLLIVALPYFIYSSTHSTLAAGATFFVSYAPQVVFGPIAGLLIDFRRRRRVLVLAQLIGGAAITLVVVAGYQRSLIAIVYPAIFVQSCAAQVFAIGRSSVTPVLVDPEHLVKANTLLTAAESASRLVGPPIGGLMLATLGLNSAVLLDVATFGCSALLVLLIKQSLELTAPPLPPGGLRGAVRAVLDGLAATVQDATVRTLIVAAGSLTVCLAGFYALVVPHAKTHIGATAAGTGVLLGALAVGSLLAAPFVAPIVRRVRTSMLLPMLLGVTGGLYVAVANDSLYWLAVLLFGVLGVPEVVMLVVARTVIQTSCQAELLGRVVSGLMSVIAACFALGAGLGSVLGGAIGTAAAMSAFGISAIAVGLGLATVWCPDRVRSGGASPEPHNAVPEHLGER